MQEQVHPRFTDREQTILLLVADGMSNREIAAHLTLSPTTVKWYVRQIFNKLGANRRTQAVKLASDLNLLEASTHGHNFTPGIPAPLSVLVGREREINDITNLINDSAVRLVTITGVGGVGKTRLALEVARRQAEQKPGQVCFVPLDAVTSLSGIIQAIASTLGVQFHGPLDIGRQLLTNLRNRNLILVLDNFEHLLEATPFVKKMLTAVPGLKILTTSRERLGVRGETVYTLRGLDIPTTSFGAQEYAAFMFFMQVAHYSQPTFQPEPDEVGHISRICKLVEGMPLAIELSAKWIDILAPAQIVDEIDRGISILKTTQRDLPERHRSMSAVFERSWQLLSDEEQDVFKNLCIFRGGFDRAAAEQVTGATLFMLSTLVDKSLLVRVGKDRFKLHELVRQFAREKLQAKEEEYRLIIQEHCKHYASLMDRWEKDIKAKVSAIPNSLLGIQNDYDNILAGWHHALESCFTDELPKYVFSVSLFFQTRGVNAEAKQTFAKALRLYDIPSSPLTAPVCVRLRIHYGWFLLAYRQFKRACQVFQKALELTPLLDDTHKADVGMLLAFLGWALYLNDQPDAGREHAKQGLVTSRSSNFQMGIWISLAILGEIELSESRYEVAYSYHRQGLAHAEQYQDLFGTIQSLAHLGCACCVLGRVDEALDYLSRALTLMRTFLTRDSLFLTIFGIAGIYIQRGRPNVALELVAILMYHPFYGSPVLGPTTHMVHMLLRSCLSTNQIDIVIEKARLGQLNSLYLDSHFTISSELVDQLFELLDEVEKM